MTRTDLGFMGVRGDEEFAYTATLSTPFVATGGTRYYVAVLNANSSWDWQLDTTGTNYFREGGDGTPWLLSGYPQQDAFQLFGSSSVPEPSTFLLGLAGASFLGAAVLFKAWRRK